VGCGDLPLSGLRIGVGKSRTRAAADLRVPHIAGEGTRLETERG